MDDSSMTRHGNNFHPELPACPFCSEWAWRSGDTTFGHGVEAWYFCRTDGCRGTGLVVWYTLNLAVIFERERIDGSCRLPAPETAWINTGARALREARINECVHGGATPPYVDPGRRASATTGALRARGVDAGAAGPARRPRVAVLRARRSAAGAR